MTPRPSASARGTAGALVLVLAAGVPLSGCETAREAVRDRERTAIGAGAGAAAGGVAGGAIGGDAKGVVVGGLLGALAGGAIGYYLDRQEQTRAQATQQVAYTPAQGTVLRVEQVGARPERVASGQTVNIETTYTVLTPTEQAVTVRETRELRHDGMLVANPTTQVTRGNGTFTSALPITLPPDAPRGAYEVLTSVAVGDRVSRGATSFTVN
jgi:surface antigen